MIIRWKNKNPFINMYREILKVSNNEENLEQKTKDIMFIINKNYSGNWLYSHPVNKHIGDTIPSPNEDVSKNPYFNLYSKLVEVFTKNDENKFNILSKELAWISITPRLEDWVYNE